MTERIPPGRYAVGLLDLGAHGEPCKILLGLPLSEELGAASIVRVGERQPGAAELYAACFQTFDPATCSWRDGQSFYVLFDDPPEPVQPDVVVSAPGVR